MTPAKLKALGDARDMPSGVIGGPCHFTIARGGVLQHVLEDCFMAGAESARKLLAPSVPSDLLIQRAKGEGS
jgi:hypothetical protein